MNVTAAAADATQRRAQWIFCVGEAVPEPTEVAAALRADGHTADLTLVSRSGLSAVTWELAVRPRGSRVLIQVGDDLAQGVDVATSDREFVLEALDSSKAAASVRRLVRVGYWDHADRPTVEALISLLCARMDGQMLHLSGEEHPVLAVVGAP
jgi:hypothetical protein